MSLRVKRFFGIGIIFTLAGIFKIYMKGVYDDQGDLKWFNILAPFGMGLLILFYTLILVMLDKKK